MRVRAERPGDVDAVRAVVSAAFDGRPNEPALVDALRRAGRAAISLVAVDGSRVVGHVMFAVVRVGGTDALALAPLSVAPDRQLSGVGAALVTAGLDAARRRGERIVLVLGDPRYYARFGFRPASEMGLEPPVATWGDAFQALRVDPRALPLSGPLLYPAEFEETGTL